MIQFLNKELSLPPKTYQDKVNLKVISDLASYGVNYDSLPLEKKHKALMTYLSTIKPDVIRKGFKPVKYVPNPDIIVIDRAPSIKDVKDNQSPSDIVIDKLITELGFYNPYKTSLTFHITKSFNDWTFPKLQDEFKYKDLEFDNISIPQVFLLLGNDVLNSFYNTNNTVQGIFGDIYLSNYKGKQRMFIPICHTAYLLREPELYKSTVLFLRYIRSILQKIKKED